MAVRGSYTKIKITGLYPLTLDGTVQLNIDSEIYPMPEGESSTFVTDGNYQSIDASGKSFQQPIQTQYYRKYYTEFMVLDGMDIELYKFKAAKLISKDVLSEKDIFITNITTARIGTTPNFKATLEFYYLGIDSLNVVNHLKSDEIINHFSRSQLVRLSLMTNFTRQYKIVKLDANTVEIKITDITNLIELNDTVWLTSSITGQTKINGEVTSKDADSMQITTFQEVPPNFEKGMVIIRFLTKTLADFYTKLVPLQFLSKQDSNKFNDAGVNYYSNVTDFKQYKCLFFLSNADTLLLNRYFLANNIEVRLYLNGISSAIINENPEEIKLTENSKYIDLIQNEVLINYNKSDK